jgi:hypothetical protein
MADNLTEAILFLAHFVGDIHQVLLTIVLGVSWVSGLAY